MPARFRIPQTDVRRLQKELKELDKDLYNEFRREMRAEMKPFAQKLQSNIPSTSPISGMSRRPPRGRQSVEERAPFVFKRPRARVSVGSGRIKSGSSGVSVVKIVFNDRRPTSAFSVMETAGTNGSNRVSRALATAGYPLKGRGRWVIPQFYQAQPLITNAARRVLRKYAEKVSKDLARRF